MANNILAFFNFSKEIFLTWDLSIFTMAFRDPFLKKKSVLISLLMIFHIYLAYPS